MFGCFVEFLPANYGRWQLSGVHCCGRWVYEDNWLGRRVVQWVHLTGLIVDVLLIKFRKFPRASLPSPTIFVTITIALRIGKVMFFSSTLKAILEDHLFTAKQKFSNISAIFKIISKYKSHWQISAFLNLSFFSDKLKTKALTCLRIGKISCLIRPGIGLFSLLRYII